MDVIGRAIKKGMHVCEDMVLQKQTWEEFELHTNRKLLFLFGVGGGLDYFFRSNHCFENIEGIIDNDTQKQSKKLGWYCAEAYQTQYSDLLIQSPKVLEGYDKDSVIVLVTSTVYYQSMIDQLRKLGISQCYSMLLMEVNARKENAKEEDFLKIQRDYIDWCCNQKIENNKIVMSYGEYGGHAKYITRELLKRRHDLDIVWLVYHEDVEAPEGVRLVPEKNWKWYAYEMETAHIWLFDITVQEFIVKRKGQIYIQTKHWSSITLKKFYLDDKSSCNSPEMERWIKYNGRMMDYLFSGSEIDEESCRSGFAFEGQNVRIGSPRSDVLFEKGIKDKVYKYYNISPEAHILLYVPTYRTEEFQKNKSMTVELEFDRLLDTVRQRYSGEWFLLVRLHPWVNFEKSHLKESHWIKNAGTYPDSEELVAACDIMITDYSSIMFEASFVKKPLFLFAPDREKYIDGERGLLLDYDSLPFPTATTNIDLANCIMDFDRKKYEKDITCFLDKFDVHEDGHASERAADFIESFI